MDLIAAERQLNDLVERRAQGRSNANALEAMYRESSRQHLEKKRRATRAAWYAHHDHMSELHAALSKEHRAKAEQLCEES